MINEHKTHYPDAALIIVGDFNHCNLRKNVSKLYQFVNFPTRGDKILDQCYSNIKQAYMAEPKPHFGKSDHVAILLKPTYTKKTESRSSHGQNCQHLDRQCTSQPAGVPGSHRHEHF